MAVKLHTAIEFKRGLTRLGLELTDAQLATLVAILDQDDNGTIEFGEFKQIFLDVVSRFTCDVYRIYR